MTTITKNQILETISNMSVIEIVDLIKAIEEKFDVKANNAINNTIEKETVEEKTEFDVLLKNIGSNKIAVIKAVRSSSGLGLKDAKDLVESAPVVIKTGISKNDAEILKKSLEQTGAEIEIK